MNGFVNQDIQCTPRASATVSELETQLSFAYGALSDLIGTFLEMYSAGENCPACGGEFTDNVENVMWCDHDETCSLQQAVLLKAEYHKSNEKKES